MGSGSAFEAVFEQLKAILSPYRAGLECVVDEPGHLSLNTRQIMKNKQPLFFGAVQTRKAYVSYYLMPVYVFPELIAEVSPELRRRMQGKSCFNFRSHDGALFAELAELTRRGYQRYEEAGYVGQLGPAAHAERP